MDDDVDDLAVVVADRRLDRRRRRVRLRQRLRAVENDRHKRNDSARLAVNSQLERLAAGQLENYLRDCVV